MGFRERRRCGDADLACSGIRHPSAGGGYRHRPDHPARGCSPLAEEALLTATSLAQRLHVPAHLVTAIDVTKLLPVEMMPTVAFDASLYEETVAQLEVQATAADPDSRATAA